MEAKQIRLEKEKLERDFQMMIRAFEESTETMIKEVKIYRSPMYTGFAENIGAIIVHLEVNV